MDTSYWLQTNPKVTVDHTTKKYFGKYLYKLVVYAPAGRLIDSKPNVTMESALEHRRSVAKHINQSGWWGAKMNKDIENADIDFLNKLRNIRHARLPGIKLRVEEPRVQIYGDSEDRLKDLVQTQFNKFQQSYIESVAGPEDNVAESVLNSGAIIRKNDIGYRYKVVLRDGRYTSDIKNSMLQYLTNLGPEQIQLPKSAVEMLQKHTSYIWNLYFYCNDPEITSFLSLIQPGIVSNCHELVVMPHK